MKQSQNNQRRAPRRKKRRSALGEAIYNGCSRVSYFFKERASTVVGGNYQVGVSVSDIVKCIVYAVLGLLLVVLQISFFSRVKPFGAVPDVLISAVFCVAMFENERYGAIFGLAVGFVAEAAGGVGLTLLPLVYMLVGFVCGLVASEYYRRSVLLFLIFDACALLVRMFTTLLYVAFTWSIVDISVIIPRVLVPEALSTLVISPIPALAVMLISRIFRGKEESKPGLD